MKFCFFLITALLLAPGLRAQQYDNPVTVPLTYYGHGNASGAASFSFGSEMGAATSGSASGFGVGFDSTSQMGNIVPGKEYTITVTSTNCNVVAAYFQPVDGCDIFINGSRMSSYSGGTNYSFKLRVETLNDLSGSLAGKRGGQCSALPEDKPIWYIGLGSLRNGRFAGAVGFRAASITTTLFNTSSLIYGNLDTSEVSVARDANGYITQIQSRDVVLQMDAYNAAGTSYGIRAYTPVNLITPFITYTVSSYLSGAGIRIDKVEDGVTWSTVLQKSGSTWTLYGWRKTTGALDTSNPVTTTVVSAAQSTVMYGSAGAGQTTKQKNYATVGGLTELSSEVWGPSLTSPQTTVYTYYSSSGGSGWSGAVQTVTQPTGKWTEYTYYNSDARAGRVATKTQPWLDTPASPSGINSTNCLSEAFDYAANYDGVLSAVSSHTITKAGQLAGKTTWSYKWSFSTVNSHPLAQIVQQDYFSVGSSVTTTTLAYLENDATTFFRGKLHAVTRPDGTKDSYAYYFGSWNSSTNTFSASSGGNDRLILALHGQTSAGMGGVAVGSWTWATGTSTTWTLDSLFMVPNLSTITETVVDGNGRTVLNAENICTSASSMERISGIALAYNGNNLLASEKDIIRSVAVAGGDVVVNHSYVCGLETTQTDIDGSVTARGYDNWLRNTTITTAFGGGAGYPAKVQNLTYYSSGLINTSQAIPTVTTYAYDTAGRMLTSNEGQPGGGTLSTSYSYATNLQVKKTLPNAATLTTDFYLDGRVKDQVGTGQVDTRFSFAIEPGTGNQLLTTQNGATTANGWSEVKTDWLGRTITKRAPQWGWTSGSTKVNRATYNFDSSTGQLTSVVTTDENTVGAPRNSPDHLYVYGNAGMVVKEGEDVTANGTLDDASADKISSYAVSFYKDTAGYNGWVRQSTVQLLRTLNNSTDVTVISDNRTRFTRFNNGVLNGSARVLSDVVDVDASNRATTTWNWSDLSARTRTQRVSVQGATQNALTTWQDGYLKSEQSISGVIKTYTYNAQGLVADATESATNAKTTYTYHSGTGYVSSMQVTTGAATTATTSYAYSWNTGSNSMVVKTTDAALNDSYLEYNALGQPWRSWGSAARPELTSYDSFGRRTGLTSWQSGAFAGSAWPSSPGAGNLTTWNVDAATGLTSSKLFPNSTSVGFTYNPRGQLKQRTWARGAMTTYNYFDTSGSMTGDLQSISYSDGTTGVGYTYSRFGAPLTITDSAGTRTFAFRSDLRPSSETLGTFYRSRVLTIGYDSYGRSTGYSYNGASTVSATFGYDPASGRANSVAGAVGTAAATFSLGYATGTDWVNSATSGSYSRSTPLASKYDVIAGATTSWSGTVLATFTAVYSDSRGWRNGQNSGSSGGTVAGSWSKSLGLGDGLHSTYGYDSYGQLNNVPTPTWQASAGAQSLPARNFGWTYDLAGNRTAETGAAPTSYTASGSNVGNGAYGTLNQYVSITGALAESPLRYDADGNLLQDGTWSYGYDAENRLKSATKTGQTLTFMYDYAGRRIAKTVNGTTVTFLWTGSRLASELASDGITPQKGFVWGLDFSDVQGRAGGSGALLAQISGGAVNYAVPDVFGNIVGYLNGSGAVVAASEFSPNGRLINSAGSATSFPIGYSGQYSDVETSLVYYGNRFLSTKHGRFINRDPIDEAGGSNLYSFAGNSSTRGWDVLGLDQEYDSNRRPIEPERVEAIRWTYCSKANYGIFGYGSSLSNLYQTEWVMAYHHGVDFSPGADLVGIATEWQTHDGVHWGYGTSDGNNFSVSPGWGSSDFLLLPRLEVHGSRSTLEADIQRAANLAYGPKSGGAENGSTLDTAGRIGGGTGAVVGTLENLQNGATGLWLGKNGRPYPTTWGGNGSTGGRLAFAGKIADTAHLAGTIVGVAGVGISLVQLGQGISAGNGNQVVQSGADIGMGVAGFFGPIGWAASTGYFVGQTIDHYTGATDAFAEWYTGYP